MILSHVEGTRQIHPLNLSLQNQERRDARFF